MTFSRCQNFQHIYQILSNGLRGLPRSARPRGWPPIVPISIKINVNEVKIMSNSLHSIRFYGFHCIPQHSVEFIAFHRILWIPLDSTGSRACHRITQDSMDFIGFLKILWISSDSVGFCGFHWTPYDSMHFIGFHTIRLDSIHQTASK